jgi:L-threonylcarbamoyladenylate synthase
MIISSKESSAVMSALNALNNNEVFVYPTDTIYGFGGNALNDKVLEKIYELKQRPDNMPVSILVKDHIMLQQYAHVSHLADRIIKKFLPGALTLVLPAKNLKLPSRLFSAAGYLGFRIPDHTFCNQLVQQFDNPIVTTSVNISGQETLNDIESIYKVFGNKVDLIISDDTLDNSSHKSGSTVIMITKDDSIKVLREGLIDSNEIISLQQ